MGKFQQGVNDLYTWCINNGEHGQQLLSEWTGINENNEQVSINNITIGSHVKMKWKCLKGHEWIVAIHQRTSGKSKGCPCCFNENRSNITRNAKIKQGVNDLYSWCLKNGSYGQLLLDEWVGLDENNRQVDIKSVARGDARRKYLWKCKVCGKKYYSLNNDRTAKLVGCPYCKGNNLKPGINDLYTWCHKNGLFGEQLLQEFGEGNNSQKYIDEKGEIKTPRDYSRGTHSRIKWTCNKGHTWNATVLSRVHYRTKCPSCSKSQTSYPEQFLFHAIKQIYPNAENRCRVLKSPEHPQGIEFDIGIPEPINGYKAVCIEYSPTRWHNGREDIDEYKIKICEEYNVELIYIRDDSYGEYDVFWGEKYICDKFNDREKEIKLLKHILKSLGHSIDEVNIDKAIKDAHENSFKDIDYNESLEYNYPELVKEWKNEFNEIKPSKIRGSSRERVYWQCTKCGYGSNGEWLISPKGRTAKGYETGCPRCGYHWHDKTYHKVTSGVAYGGVNDIEHLYPELAKEFNDKFCNTKPSSVTKASHKPIYWRCNNCQYGNSGEWMTIVANRVYFKSGCPQCGYNWYKAQTGQPQRLKNGYELKVNESVQMIPKTRVE